MNKRNIIKVIIIDTRSFVPRVSILITANLCPSETSQKRLRVDQISHCFSIFLRLSIEISRDSLYVIYNSDGFTDFSFAQKENTFVKCHLSLLCSLLHGPGKFYFEQLKTGINLLLFSFPKRKLERFQFLNDSRQSFLFQSRPFTCKEYPVSGVQQGREISVSLGYHGIFPPFQKKC